MFIQTFNENGKSIYTGFGEIAGEIIVKKESKYKVVGDACFHEVNGEYRAWKVTYSQNGTSLGDIMTNTNASYTVTSTWLRIKQHLELPGMKYDYIKTFVSNVKGADKDVEFMGYTFNFAKMDGVVLDKMLKTVLFAVQFPDANTIRYTCQYNDFNMELNAPIEVDGNKMTIKMSERDAAYKDVDLYTFQDQDNTQMHMYMPTYAFETFFANMQIAFMSELGQLDKTDAAAVEAVFNSIDEAVETINLSLVMTKAAR